MDLRTSYVGLRLDHPFVAGASPLSYRLDGIRRIEDGGCAAVVVHSLFEEQITEEFYGHIAHANVFEEASADVRRMFPDSNAYPIGPDGYAEHIRRAKDAVDIPVIASLNGRTPEVWLKFARLIEQAGADAIELSIYSVAADLSTSGVAVEDQLESIVRDVKRLLRIPVAVKLSPFFTAFGALARRLTSAGADGLVLFNRFYQPDIDIETLKLEPRAELSTSAELLLRLRWLAILCGRVSASLAVSGGVTTPADGIKATLAGADVIQMASALLRHGPEYVGIMRSGLERWLDAHEMTTLREAQGLLSLDSVEDAATYERAQYIHTLHRWTDAQLADSPVPVDTR